MIAALVPKIYRRMEKYCREQDGEAVFSHGKECFLLNYFKR